MNSKRTHKLVAMGDAGAVVAGSPSVTVAAKRLGVARKTVYEWIKAGKVPKPGGVLPAMPVAVTGGLEPAAWAAKVRAARTLDVTASTLLDLAEDALVLVHDATQPMVRLAAMTRFQALVKQLRLDEPAVEQDEAEPVRVPTVRRVTHDPRRAVMAIVK